MRLGLYRVHRPPFLQPVLAPPTQPRRKRLPRCASGVHYGQGRRRLRLRDSGRCRAGFGVPWAGMGDRGYGDRDSV